MIACYAWTNLHILNITNTKLNLFPDETADLYILIPKYDQVSLKLIYSVKSMEVFRNIHYIEPPQIIKRHLLLGFIPKIRNLFLKRGHLLHYNRVLDNLVEDDVCNRVLVPCFIGLSGVLFFVNYWYKKNKKLKITFVEEGAGTYLLTMKEMFNVKFPDVTIGAKVSKWLLYSRYSKKYSKLVDSIYVYAPAILRPCVKIEKKSIPSLSMNNGTMLSLVSNATHHLDMSHFIRYNKSDVYFFSNYAPNRTGFETRSYEILEAIMRSAKCSRIIVKAHTNSPRHSEKFAADYENMVYVDRHNYLFEGILHQIADVEKKVFIGYISSTLLYPKIMFNKEPHIVLIHRLYTSTQKEIERDEKFASDMLSLYDDKTKVLIPNSLLEMQEMIGSALHQSTPLLLLQMKDIEDGYANLHKSNKEDLEAKK